MLLPAALNGRAPQLRLIVGGGASAAEPQRQPVAAAGGAGLQPGLQLEAPARPPLPGDATPLDDRHWIFGAGAAPGFARRLLDCIPALLTWTIVLAPLWAGFFMPVPLAIAILLFDCYWLYLSLSTAWRARVAYRQMVEDAATDWRKQYRAARVFGRTRIEWDAVRHIVIIPNYREDEAILDRTLASLAAQSDTGQLHVILAMEARDPEAELKAHRLVRRYSGRFGGLYTTYHPAGLPGEIAGKSANEAWAARWARTSLCGPGGFDLALCTITSCDADSVFHPAYFACLTYRFATDENRYRRFWQSAILLNNNIWDSPAPLRVASSLAGVHILSNLARRSRMMFPQSTYSLSMQMADDAGYWDADVIPEDWHMFLKCFFAFRGEVHVEPIFLPTGNDAVLSNGYRASLKMAYVQHKRHAWGSSDVPYMVLQSIGHPEIPFLRKARRFAALEGNHLIWATHWFILSLGWIMPDIIARLIGHDHVPLWLPIGARALLWGCLLPYVSMFFLDRRLRPAKPAGWRPWQTAVDVLWWALLPVTSLLFSTIPALDAQTRLALGKRLEYRVTVKQAARSVSGITPTA